MRLIPRPADAAWARSAADATESSPSAGAPGAPPCPRPGPSCSSKVMWRRRRPAVVRLRAEQQALGHLIPLAVVELTFQVELPSRRVSSVPL